MLLLFFALAFLRSTLVLGQLAFAFAFALLLRRALASRLALSSCTLGIGQVSFATRCSCRLLHNPSFAILEPFLACSGLFWGGRLGCGPQRRTRWGGAFVSTLPLWFRANSVACRRSRYGFARIRSRCGFTRIPGSSCLLWPLLGGPLMLAATAYAVGRSTLPPLWFRNAPAVVLREFRCVSMLPLWFRANSGLFWPALAGGAA